MTVSLLTRMLVLKSCSMLHMLTSRKTSVWRARSPWQFLLHCTLSGSFPNFGDDRPFTLADHMAKSNPGHFMEMFVLPG